MNMLAGAEVFPLQSLFDDLRHVSAPGAAWSDTPRANYVWLYAMMFSTLVPTLIHAGFSCLSLTELAPTMVRARLVTLIDRRDESQGAEYAVTLVLGLSRFVSFALPLVALAMLVWALHSFTPQIGETYLQFFEVLARWLGQIDKIGPGYIPESWGKVIEI